MIHVSTHNPARAPYWKRVTALVPVCCLLALGLALPVGSQEVSPDEVGGVPMDPISFRGPKPSDRFDEIKIEQKLDAQVPLDLPFVDESGNPVVLGDFFNQGRPVLLTLVYYECPMLCNMALNHTAAAMNSVTMDLNPGVDYDIVTVSIDPDETHELAAAKKANYVEALKRDGAAEGWHFLTGKDDDIRSLATAVGFRYYYDSQIDQYAHAAGIMILTPEGRVSSYYLGLDYRPNNLELALVDASSGKIGSLAHQLVLLCYDYDPATGTYGFYVMGAMRIAGIITIMCILAFWAVQYRAYRRGGRNGLDESPTEVTT